METNTDHLAKALHAAMDAHAATVARGASMLEVLQAVRAVQVATGRLAIDSGEDESSIIFAIEDIDAEIAALVAK